MPFKDKVSTADGVSAAVELHAVAPKHPCPLCGKESKARNHGLRVCVGCKYIFPPEEPPPLLA